MTEIAHSTLALYRETATPAAVDLKQTVESSLELLAKRAKDNGIRLSTEFLGPLIIEAYGGGVRQIVINLVRNAIEASEQNGTVRVCVRPVTDEVLKTDGYHIIVKDSGCGIPESSLPDLFRPFLSTKENGNGIGLWIVKQIVEKHGGAITVQSRTTLPSGTEFTVWLPAIAAPGMLQPVASVTTGEGAVACTRSRNFPLKRMHGSS